MVIAAIKRAETLRPLFKEIVPTFWDPALGAKKYGVIGLSTSAILANLCEYMGIYAVLQSSVVYYGPTQDHESFDPTLRRVYPELAALLHDPNATLSLWLVPANHHCVPDSESGPGPTPGPSTLRPKRLHDDLGALISGSGSANQRSPATDADAPDSHSDSDADPELLALPLATAPVDVSSPAVLRAPACCSCAPERHPPPPALAAHAVRLALDFALPTGRPARRTGVLRLRACPGPRGHPVHWDDDPTQRGGRWVAAGAGLALDADMGAGDGADTPLPAAGLSFTAARADGRGGASFAFMVWTFVLPISSPSLDGGAPPRTSAFAITLLAKRMRDAMAPRGVLSESECRRLGLMPQSFEGGEWAPVLKSLHGAEKGDGAVQRVEFGGGANEMRKERPDHSMEAGGGAVKWGSKVEDPISKRSRASLNVSKSYERFMAKYPAT